MNRQTRIRYRARREKEAMSEAQRKEDDMGERYLVQVAKIADALAKLCATLCAPRITITPPRGEGVTLLRAKQPLEAFQWMIDRVPQWWKDRTDLKVDVATGEVHIPSSVGTRVANPGDWIIRSLGDSGDLFPVTQEYFDRHYEIVSGE
jgi:hypothetical protein